MRNRERVIQSLEGVYREAFEGAGSAGDEDRMGTLDFGFQRDQILLEVLLDVRDALAALDQGEEKNDPSLLDKAKAVRKFTKLGGL